MSELDRRRLFFFLVAVGGLLLYAVAISLFPGNNVHPLLAVGGPAVWVGFSWVAWHRWQFYRCPRCGERFFRSIPTDRKYLLRSPYSNECVCCGYVLPKV